MENQRRTAHVPGISCGHCTATIERELGELDGITRVEADAATRTVLVEWSRPATWAEIEETLRDIGFKPAAGDTGA